MKNFISIILFTAHIISYCQTSSIIEVKELYAQDKFEEIITNYTEEDNEYDSEALYYIAMCYYIKQDDENCIKYIDLSIAKDKTNPKAFFVKGMTQNYLGDYNNGSKSFQKSIELDPSNGNTYCGLGDSYYNQNKLKKALKAYTTSIEKSNYPDRSYLMVPQVFNDLNQPDQALLGYYKAKEKISKETGSYMNCLFNIGLHELIRKDYSKAEIAFTELIEIEPNDQETLSKLIQVYYGQKEYSKVKPLKRRLYSVHARNKENGALEAMYCFDQFNLNGKQIKAYEKFDSPEGQIYYKHVFYILDDQGNIDYSVHTENSPISIELGGPKYILGKTKGNVHTTYAISFEEDFNYDDLKIAVIKIIDNKITASSSSTIAH